MTFEKKRWVLEQIHEIEHLNATGPTTLAILLLVRVIVELDLDAAGHVDRRLEQLLTHVCAIAAQGDQILMASAELKASLARIDAATNNIAADVRRLKDRVGTGISENEVAEIQTEADRIAEKLEGLAADPDNPDPEAPATT